LQLCCSNTVSESNFSLKNGWCGLGPI
jgi:hypothetical protein